ncbi:hypothetical protein SDC9_202647 [bioreactor metagenome]|uniref:Uncharacterized protein n=1 Tax=bioreactor metagenome TaxID=1076179 RepID=A0A645IU73_9ZZZZ
MELQLATGRSQGRSTWTISFQKKHISSKTMSLRSSRRACLRARRPFNGKLSAVKPPLVGNATRNPADQPSSGSVISRTRLWPNGTTGTGNWPTGSPRWTNSPDSWNPPPKNDQLSNTVPINSRSPSLPITLAL